MNFKQFILYPYHPRPPPHRYEKAVAACERADKVVELVKEGMICGCEDFVLVGTYDEPSKVLSLHRL